MYAKSAVNVRDLPSTDGKKIGSLKASQEITVTGKCDQTGWYRFDLNGTTGYVSDKYIVSEKPAVNTVASANNSSNTCACTDNYNRYDGHLWRILRQSHGGTGICTGQ